MDVQHIFARLDGLFAENRIQEAESFLLSCLEQAKEEGDYGAYLSVGNELIGYYRSVSAHEKAFAMAEDVLLLMEELNMEETEHFATTLLNAATAYRAAGKPREALADYARALQIYEKTIPADDYRFAGLYNNVSILLEQLGENEKAAAFLEHAIAIVEKQPDARMDLATSKTNLALLYFKMQKEAQAQELLEDAIRIYQESEGNTDAHYSAALAGMGEAYFRMGRLERSFSYYQQAVEETKKHFGKNDSYRLLCGNCAAVLRTLGRLEEAQQYENEANHEGA